MSRIANISGGHVHFTLSNPPSTISSRCSSPEPPETPILRLNDTFSPEAEDSEEDNPPADLYDATLPWWRAAIRRKIVQSVRWESEIIAAMQERIRTPWFDQYFVYTSSLGTHTFFMILLPVMFFFGYEELGLGLTIILGLGVYWSSFFKDLICSPRPFTPPVTRLTIGSHHLEYGFPSTHSTNSVSIALFFYTLVHHLATTPANAPINYPDQNNISSNASHNTTLSYDIQTPAPAISSSVHILLSAILFIYTFSIVFGRLYTAMHSFTDCLAGVVLGAGLWWAQTSFPGIQIVVPSDSVVASVLRSTGFGTQLAEGGIMLNLFAGLNLGSWVEQWALRGSYEVPVILISLFLLLVNQHPQPVDDCPCFEDAIAFGSVVLGVLLGRWGLTSWREGWLGQSIIMPGSGYVYDAGRQTWLSVERGWGDVLVWWSVASLKIVTGIFTIFIWRILAKSLLHLILPPTFRFLSRAVSPFHLPHRRFYTPATEYKHVPSEFNSGDGLRPIPSVIDLPSTVEVGEELGGIGTGAGSITIGHRIANGDVRARVAGSEKVKTKTSPLLGDAEVSVKQNGDLDVRWVESEGKDRNGEPVRHYDADVLTKVIVYAGIAVISTHVMPITFELLGWGVKSWP